MKVIAKFLGVGGIATLIQYLILMSLVEITGLLPYIASTIGYMVSAILNYFLNYYFSFGSSANHISAITKFSVVASIGLLINATVVYISSEILYTNYIIAQVLATCIVTISNFLLLKNWAYK